MKRPWVKFLLRGLFSAGLFALLLSRVRWSDLAVLLRGVSLAPLLAGWLFGLFSLLLLAARTRLMLGQWKIFLNYRPVLGLTWLGQFCNAFLPGSTGGDLVKFVRLCRLVPGAKAAGFAALVADRVVALFALVALAGSVSAFGDHRFIRELLDGAAAGFNSHRWLLSTAAALAGLAALAGALLWRRLGTRAGQLAERIRRVVGTFAGGLRPTPAVGAAFLLALAVHLLSLGTCYLYCRALQIPATFTQVVLVWPVVMIAVMLPLTMNGHGLREYIMLFYFTQWRLASALPGGGGTPETVVALSLLMVATDFSWSLPGGLYLMVQGRNNEPPAPAAEPSVGRPPLHHAPTLR